MLKACPIQSKDEQKKLCELCETEYNPDWMAYSANVDGKDVGICQFTIKAEGGIIKSIARVKGTDDFEAMFVLGRAAMNFINLCGNETVFFDCDGVIDEPLIKAIGFKKSESGRYEVKNLTDFFTHPCQHK